jgi:hypothetical protein
MPKRHSSPKHTLLGSFCTPESLEPVLLRLEEMRMNRRTLLRCAGLAGIAKAGQVAVGQTGASVGRKGTHPIVPYCDLRVDPAREQEMLHRFHNDFKPVAEKFEGYIGFQLTYESEELRQKWIATAVHQQQWPLSRILSQTKAI